MNKKYFFFDIDGTLTDKSTGKIVPSAQLALNELQKAGHFVAIATGRAHYKARNFMESVGLHDMVCCGGGGPRAAQRENDVGAAGAAERPAAHRAPAGKARRRSA